jgi:hypothetical protein
MTDLTTLRDLKERVDKATGPNRDIDGAIYAALMIPKERAGRIDQAGGVVGWWPKDGPYVSAIDVPGYTTSIDASLALVGRVTGEGVILETKPPRAGIGSDGLCPSKGASPALAVISSCLSVLIAKEEARMKEGAEA